MPCTQVGMFTVNCFSAISIGLIGVELQPRSMMFVPSVGAGEVPTYYILPACRMYDRKAVHTQHVQEMAQGRNLKKCNFDHWSTCQITRPGI